MNSTTDDQRHQALEAAAHQAISEGWVIESRTDLSVSLRRKPINHAAWLIGSVLTTPFVFGLGFAVWAIVAAQNRSQRLIVWVQPDGTVRRQP